MKGLRISFDAMSKIFRNGVYRKSVGNALKDRFSEEPGGMQCPYIPFCLQLVYSLHPAGDVHDGPPNPLPPNEPKFNEHRT